MKLSSEVVQEVSELLDQRRDLHRRARAHQSELLDHRRDLHRRARAHLSELLDQRRDLHRRARAHLSTAPCPRQVFKDRMLQSRKPLSRPLCNNLPIHCQSLKNVKKRVNRKARELLLKLRMEDLEKILKELRWKFITIVVFSFAFWAPLWAWKSVACNLLALQCKNAVLDYNVPQKLLVAGAVMWDRVLWAAKGFKQAEKSYELHAKVMLVWMKAKEAGQVAEHASTIWTNMEKVYQIIEKLSKGGKSP